MLLCGNLPGTEPESAAMDKACHEAPKNENLEEAIPQDLAVNKAASSP